MKKVEKNVWIFILIFIIGICFQKEISANEEFYDSTYVLSVSQKFAIPENVTNGDYVGYWKKTYTWTSDGVISYNLTDDYDNAFAINSSTGLITVNDASKINGNIIQQDEVIHLIVETIDSKEGSELDTAYIWVKRNSHCVFIDFNASDPSENGTRNHPYNDMDDISITVGYGYFLKRGSQTTGETTLVHSHYGSKDHPTMIAAYAQGEKPKFIGGSATPQAFYFGTDEGDPIATRVDHFYIYDITITEYKWPALYWKRTSAYSGIYNCEFINNDIDYHESQVVLSTSSNADTATQKPFEFINCEWENTNSDSHIKIGAVGPTVLLNCRFGKATTAAVRMGGGSGHGRNIVKHCYIETGSTSMATWNNAVQLRGDNITVEDCIIIGNYVGIRSSSGTSEVPMMGDSMIIKNCYLKGQFKYGIQINPPSSAYEPSFDHLYEQNLIRNTDIGILDNNGVRTKIRNNIIHDITSTGISINDYDNNDGKDGIIDHNQIFNILSGNNIETFSGSGYILFNNTTDGTIDLSGATECKVYHCLYRQLQGNPEEYLNFDLDTMQLDDIFLDFSNNDFRLDSTYAKYMIDVGKTEITTSNGTIYIPYSGNSPDIGAIEHSGAQQRVESNNQPIIFDQDFYINEKEFTNNFVGQILASDSDPEQSLFYSIISGNSDGLFLVETSTGKLKTTSENIFSSGNDTYTLNVQVKDDGENPLTNTALITVYIEKVEVEDEDIVYIDPQNKNDASEDGSIEHPFDSWQDVQWMTGYKYVQKRGTVSEEGKISIYSNDVTIGAYGEGEIPIIVSSAEDYAIKAFEKSSIKVENIKVIADNAISCLYFLGETCDDIIIEKSTFEGSLYGVRIINGKGITIRYSTFSEINNAIQSYAGNTTIYYNIFQNNQNSIDIIGTDASANIYNNVFHDNNTSITASYSNITLYNNIFYFLNKSGNAINIDNSELVSDYNIYYPEQNGIIDYNGKQYTKLADFQKIEGIDANSFSSDPQFVDAYYQNFRLSNTSPAIDVGRQVGIEKDFLGNNVPEGGAPDIGIVEMILDNLTGLNKEGSELISGKFKIYPNPSTGIVNISFENAKDEEINLHIKDMSGRTLIEKNFYSTGNEFEQSLDLTHLKNGIYIVWCKLSDKLLSNKIVLGTN